MASTLTTTPTILKVEATLAMVLMTETSAFRTPPTPPLRLKQSSPMKRWNHGTTANKKSTKLDILKMSEIPGMTQAQHWDNLKRSLVGAAFKANLMPRSMDQTEPAHQSSARERQVSKIGALRATSSVYFEASTVQSPKNDWSSPELAPAEGEAPLAEKEATLAEAATTPKGATAAAATTVLSIEESTIRGTPTTDGGALADMLT